MARQKRKIEARLKAARPHHDALKNLIRDACVRASTGDHANAAVLFRHCLDRDDTFAPAWTGLATALKRQADLPGAMMAYKAAILLDPLSASSHIGLAEVLLLQGHLREALESCERGLLYEKGIGEGHIIRAYIRKDLGDLDKAVDDLALVVKSHPHSVPLHALSSEILVRLERLEEASDMIGRAVLLAPQDLSLRDRQASILLKLDRAEEAAKAWEAAVSANTDSAEAHRSLASLYKLQGRTREAFDTYQKAITLDPKSTRTYLELAKLMMDEYQIDLAESLFRMIVLLDPENPNSHYNLGMCLNRQDKIEEATISLRQAMALDPKHLWALADLCYIRQKCCDWSGLKAQQESACGSDKGGLSPFLTLSYMTTSSQKALAAARQWSKRYASIARLPPRSIVRDGLLEKHRIRVGYVSSDFHNHATVMLMIGLLEKHDRARFEILAYSFSPDDQTTLRQRFIDAVDVFIDVRNASAMDIARRIRADEIDILVDLKGFTQDSRTEIFAARPAPIQVNYLGYPGSMGADFIDYIVADHFITPVGSETVYQEKIVRLPHSYQPNDARRRIPDFSPTRDACGLPEDAIVFCCFNNAYKITEDLFDIWMRLLHKTPGSVLWLLAINTVTAGNLHREAALRGISKDRLVFAPKVPLGDHLARLQVADLFLDTLPYNAHTTASEALWMGLPVLTCVGETFAGRVGGSLLTAVGLPELIMSSLAAYEAEAIRLAHAPYDLRRLREKLVANRFTTPLFDSDRYTRNFEAALTHMFDLHRAQKPPEAFAVVDREGEEIDIPEAV